MWANSLKIKRKISNRYEITNVVLKTNFVKRIFKNFFFKGLCTNNFNGPLIQVTGFYITVRYTLMIINQNSLLKFKVTRRCYY